MSRYKTIYKDNVTGKLLHKEQADERDPSTYTIEQFDREAAIASVKNSIADDVPEIHEETTDI